MASQDNWLQILLQCKNSIQKQIAPFLSNSTQQQQNLGIGVGGDPIKKTDLVAEKAIINTLKRHDISFTLVSEESGVIEYGKTPHKNFVTADPIDGTTNLTRGIPFYATSIAVSTKPTLDTIHSALVADLYHDVTYTAQKGKGAYRNNHKITSSESMSLEEAVIGMDINTFKIQKLIPQLIGIIKKTKHIRHLGANALELCYVADGTTDAFIDIRGKLRATDMAAAWLIIKESGGEITNLEGKPLNIKLDPRQKVDFIAAANRKIYEIILTSMKKS